MSYEVGRVVGFSYWHENGRTIMIRDTRGSRRCEEKEGERRENERKPEGKRQLPKKRIWLSFVLCMARLSTANGWVRILRWNGQNKRIFISIDRRNHLTTFPY